MKLGEKIERSIKIDYAISVTSSAKFARLCVEVDLSKPLLPKFYLRKKVRRIEYEGLYLVCFKCGIYGHREDTCNIGVDNGGGMNEVKAIDNPEAMENYGPWVLATKKNRRNAKAKGQKNGCDNTMRENVEINNPFMVLENIEEEGIGLDQIEA